MSTQEMEIPGAEEKSSIRYVLILGNIAFLDECV